ncbi:hypothetical protein KI387_036388, partial [Taxus chinensis]
MAVGEGGKNIASHPHSGSDNNQKRKRNDETQDEDLKEDFIMFKDTLIALKIMRSQFPMIEKVVVKPFVLRSQLYSSIKDRTQVDRELEDLRKEEVLRIFKLNTGQDDNAIMFMDDYLQQ